MKFWQLTPSRILIILLMLVVMTLQTYMYAHRPRPTREEAVHLMSVLQRFSEEQQRKGVTPRSSIAIEELIGAGYLTEKEVRPIHGADVWFSSADLKRDTKQILIKVNLQGGGQVWLLSDGTIRQFLAP